MLKSVKINCPRWLVRLTSNLESMPTAIAAAPVHFGSKKSTNCLASVRTPLAGNPSAWALERFGPGLPVAPWRLNLSTNLAGETFRAFK